jgi:hypothetical protein
MSARKDGPKTSSVTHIRRCHVCGTVNELEGSANLHCHKCGKHLAPFYFFDESSLQGLSESELYLTNFCELKTQQNSDKTAVHPIWGLSTYWTEEDIGDEVDNRRHQKRKSKHPGRHSRNRG